MWYTSFSVAFQSKFAILCDIYPELKGHIYTLTANGITRNSSERLNVVIDQIKPRQYSR